MKRYQKYILLIVLLIWCAGIFVEWLVKLDNHLFYTLPFLQKSYSLVCHQQKSKLISFDNAETLTCARCTGIYIGLLFTSIIVLLKEPKRKLPVKFLFISAVPMIADVVIYSLGLYHYSKLAAFITGFLLGSVGFLYLYAGLKNLILELKN